MDTNYVCVDVIKMGAGGRALGQWGGRLLGGWLGRKLKNPKLGDVGHNVGGTLGELLPFRKGGRVRKRKATKRKRRKRC